MIMGSKDNEMNADLEVVTEEKKILIEKMDEFTHLGVLKRQRNY